MDKNRYSRILRSINSFLFILGWITTLYKISSISFIKQKECVVTVNNRIVLTLSIAFYGLLLNKVFSNSVINDVNGSILPRV